MEIIISVLGLVGFIGFAIGRHAGRSDVRNEQLKEATDRLKKLITPVDVPTEGALPGETLEKAPAFIPMTLKSVVKRADGRPVTPELLEDVEPQVQSEEPTQPPLSNTVIAQYDTPAHDEPMSLPSDLMDPLSIKELEIRDLG